jgi:hypothetical protein
MMQEAAILSDVRGGEMYKCIKNRLSLLRVVSGFGTQRQFIFQGLGVLPIAD